MGLIKSAISSLSGALGDQWKEAYHCPVMSNDIILRRGVRMNQGKGSNNKGNPDVISNGSVIVVEENVCMLTIDNGKITNIVTEPGHYVFDSSSAPSIFAGQISASLKDVLTRFMFGGAASVQQRVIFINLQPLPGIPFGTSTPMPYFDPAYNTSIDLRFHGTFEIQIADAEMAVKFYNQVGSKGLDSGDVPVNDIFKSEQYKKEFMQAIMKSLNMLSNKGVRYSQISAYLDDLTREAQEVTRTNWLTRGFMIVNVALSAVTITDESKELLGDRLKADTMLGGDVQRAMMVGGVARGIENAAANPGGAMMGFMGMNMASQAAGNVLGQFGEAPATGMAQQTQQAATSQMGAMGAMGTPSAANMGGWTCACGVVNSGKFCSECGASQPVPVSSDTWKCACGVENKGRFCSECGASKPDNNGEWKCDCGVVNKGKFCSNCGKQKN